MSPLTEAERSMVSANVALVYWVVDRWFFGHGYRGNDIERRDEMVSAGMDGLVRAVRGFDASLGFRFSTYARKVIWSSVKAWLRTEFRERDRRTLFTDIEFSGPDLRGEALALDCESSGEAERVDRDAALERLLGILDDRSRAMVCQRYLEDGGATLEAVGKIHGLTRERIRQVVQKSLFRISQLACRESLL